MNWPAFSIGVNVVALLGVWWVVRTNRRTRRLLRETQSILARLGAGVDLRVTIDGHELVNTDSEKLYYLSKLGGAGDAAGWTDLLNGDSAYSPVDSRGVLVHVRPRQLVANPAPEES